MSVSPTGPIPSDVFKTLVDAPHGKALEAIRKYDPLYGKLSSDGEPRKWRVKLSKDVQATAYVMVEATTEKDAEALAHEISDHTIDWDFEDDGAGFWVEEVKPK